MLGCVESDVYGSLKMNNTLLPTKQAIESTENYQIYILFFSRKMAFYNVNKKQYILNFLNLYKLAATTILTPLSLTNQSSYQRQSC